MNSSEVCCGKKSPHRAAACSTSGVEKLGGRTGGVMALSFPLFPVARACMCPCMCVCEFTRGHCPPVALAP